MADLAHPTASKIVRVGELTRYLKYLLEHDELLSALSVRGEISDFSRSPSGHIYFTLKDSSSQVSCVLFRREALQQGDNLRSLRKGVSVVVHGFLTVYEPRGSYQLYVERIVTEGEGVEHRRVEEMRIKLEGEGLFAAERKRPIPPYPRQLALVTSPGSQAYHDVLHRLSVQFPLVRVIEVGVSVQGDGAADEMAMALDIVNRLTDADVILLVRGGGAPEELAAFNEERLVRAIFASRIPVVTGVGHETDYTLVDFVADRRAATPSLAAAVAVPDGQAHLHRIAQLHNHMSLALQTRLRADRHRWLQANRALIRSSPQERLRSQRQRVEGLERSLHLAFQVQLRARRARLASLQAQLRALDPLSVLSRGYAVVTDRGTGQVVGRMAKVRPGQLLAVRFADGQISVRVEER